MNYKILVLADDLMLQLRLKSAAQNMEFIHSLPDFTALQQDELSEYLFLIDLQAWSFDPIEFINAWKEWHDSVRPAGFSLIAFTGIKHDHAGIHKARVAGAPFVLEMDQIMQMLEKLSLSSQNNL
jgi:hypothetical protein